MQKSVTNSKPTSKKDFDIQVKSFFGGFGSYLDGLSQIDLPAEARAKNPLMNHPWVFAAAMVTSIVASQAPFVVWRETDKQQKQRQKKEIAKGRYAFARAGKQRRAMLRHDVRKVASRVMHKGIEIDDTHPLIDLIESPNPFQDGGQLWFMTHMLLVAEGEVMWVLTDDDGNPSTIEPTRIYPMRGQFMTEVLSQGDHGDFIGFMYTPPKWMPGRHYDKVFVPAVSVIHFKLPNPFNPLRGLSRLTPSGGAIESSLLAKAWNRAMLRNSGVPKGIVGYTGTMDPSDRQEFLSKWSDKFEGPENQGRTALLSEGFTYQGIGMSPSDMQYNDMNTADREEVLAVMQMPKTILGLTDSVNYATSQGQDRNFWDKSVIPLMSLEEKAVDRSIFFTETDSTFGAFDLGSVESLRIGLESKVKLAHQLADKNLHMPPDVAFRVVGLEVEEYSGIDTVLISGLVSTLEDVLEPLDITLPAPVAPGGNGGAPSDDGAGAPSDDELEVTPDVTPPEKSKIALSSLDSSCSAITRAKNNVKTQRRFQLLQGKVEVQFFKRYRRWVKQMKKEMMERFEQFATESKAKQLLFNKADVPLTQILPNLAESQQELKTLIRPLYSTVSDLTYEFTLEEIGVPTFAADDSKIYSFFERREKLYSNTIPNTLIKKLSATMQTGISNGESLFQIQLRIQEIFAGAAAPSKALTVARTESASFMNGVRNEMFDLQGITKEGWASAEDEATREDHLAFGESDPERRGFNWLSVVGAEGDGILEFPGDDRAPAGQVINCRCVKIPVE